MTKKDITTSESITAAQPVVSRRAATIVNLIHQYVAIGLAIVNGVVLVPLCIKYIDYTLYGAWLASGGVAAWLMLADVGLADILRQRTAQIYGQKDLELLGKIVTTGLVCIAVVGVLPFLLSLAIAPFLPHLFKLENSSSISLVHSFIFTGVASSLVLISGGAQAAQQGLQCNVAFSIIYNGGSVVGIIVTILMLIRGYGLISIPIGLTIRGIMWIIGSWGHLFWFCCYSLGLRMHYTKEHLREIINLAGWTLFSRSAYQLFAKLDAFVVGLVLGPAVTPIFVLTGRAWDIALLLLERMPIAAMPSLAHLHGEGDTWHYARISKHILKMVSYISLISIGTVFALNGSFVRLWIVGKNVYAGFSFDIALSMAIGLMVFASAAYHILYAKGLIRKLCILTASLSISRAALMTGLVLLMGYIGGPLSVIIAFSAAIAVFYIPTLSYHLEISKKTVRWAVMHLAKLSVPVFALAMIVHYTINITSWPTLVITALGYAACIILVFLCIDKNVRQMAFAIAARIYRLNLV